jgi:hypothetical protein
MAIAAVIIIYLGIGFFVAFSVMLPDGNPLAKWSPLIWIGWPVYLLGVTFGWWE